MKIENQIQLDRYVSTLGFPVEVVKYKNTRTSAQNRALHLFFTTLSSELNDIGLTYTAAGYEIPFTPEVVKTIWRQIQEAMFETKSTTQLKADQINPILDVLANHFSEMGIPIYFPSEFSYYLNQIG